MRSRRGVVTRTVIESAVASAIASAAVLVVAPAQASAGAGGNDRLNGVVAISPVDAWAVGLSSTAGDVTSTLIENWDGKSWQAVPSPSPGGASVGARSLLNAVAATSATDVWAVGSHTAFGDDNQSNTLIEHWDGVSWTQVASFSEGSFAELNSVVALSPTDAWAVGTAVLREHWVPVIEHWDGKSWQPVRSPALLQSSLTGIAGTSPGNLWAVGSHFSFNPLESVTLVEHWNGNKWSRVPSASPGGKGVSSLLAATAIPGTGAWAAGFSDRRNKPGVTLIEHRSGSKWIQVPSPAPASPEDELLGIAIAAPKSIFAVGYIRDTGTLIEHWNGSKWTIQRSPVNRRGGFTDLAAVATDSASDGWAAGGLTTRMGKLFTLIVHWNGKSWRRVVSPSP